MKKAGTRKRPAFFIGFLAREISSAGGCAALTHPTCKNLNRPGGCAALTHPTCKNPNRPGGCAYPPYIQPANLVGRVSECAPAVPRLKRSQPLRDGRCAGPHHQRGDDQHHATCKRQRRPARSPPQRGRFLPAEPRRQMPETVHKQRDG